MKQLLLVLTLLVGTFIACKKDKLHVNSPVVGSWKWEHSVGGFSGADSIKPAVGSTVVLTFKNDLTYTVTLNSQVVNEGTYQITAPADLPIIQFSNMPPSAGGLLVGTNGVSFNPKDNTLKLTDEYISEGYTHLFTKSTNQ